MLQTPRVLARLTRWKLFKVMSYLFFFFLTIERFKESILPASNISACAAFLVHYVHFLRDSYRFFSAALRILWRVPFGFDSLALLTSGLLYSSPAMKKSTVKKGKKRASASEAILPMLLASVSEVSMFKEVDNDLSKVLYLVAITSDLQCPCQEEDLKVNVRKETRNKTKLEETWTMGKGGKATFSETDSKQDETTAVILKLLIILC